MGTLSGELPTDLPPTSDDRTSGMRLDISFSIGYRRRRSGGIDRWEARLTTAGLLAAGVVVVAVVLLVLIPRILSGL